MCCDVFTTYIMNYNLLPRNPQILRLYGLTKIHKDGIPITPVVSFCNTPVSLFSYIYFKNLKM